MEAHGCDSYEDIPLSFWRSTLMDLQESFIRSGRNGSNNSSVDSRRISMLNHFTRSHLAKNPGEVSNVIFNGNFTNSRDLHILNNHVQQTLSQLPDSSDSAQVQLQLKEGAQFYINAMTEETKYQLLTSLTQKK